MMHAAMSRYDMDRFGIIFRVDKSGVCDFGLQLRKEGCIRIELKEALKV